MSAAHQLKKVRQQIALMNSNERLQNWLTGSKKRTFAGVVYGTRKEARMARDNARKIKATIKKLREMETGNGREEADRSAP